MASIKARQQLPDLAKPTADLIEKFGFQWELDFEYPTPDPAKRVQIREEKHYVPRAMVMQIAAAMARRRSSACRRHQRRLPGRRQHAHRGRPPQQAPVRPGPHLPGQLRRCHREGSAQAAPAGAAFNARHGKGIDREEIRKAVEFIGQDPTYDGTRIAALIGVTDATVKSMLTEMRARQRANNVGVNLNGSVGATPLRVLGQASEKLNDEPFPAVAELAQDTGMSGPNCGMSSGRCTTPSPMRARYCRGGTPQGPAGADRRVPGQRQVQATSGGEAAPAARVYPGIRESPERLDGA